MRVRNFPTADEAKRELANRISSTLSAFNEGGIPVLFLFSGGSALTVLESLNKNAFGLTTMLAPIDERYDPSRKESNFEGFLRTESFKRARAAGASFIDTRVVEGEGRDDLGERFEEALRHWVGNYPEGRIVALFGMGVDGHTAGIFPDEDRERFERRFYADRWVVSYRAPENAVCPERITTTMTFFAEKVDRSYAYFTGIGKKPVWDRVLSGSEPTHRLPAMVFRKFPSMEIFTDIT